MRFELDRQREVSIAGLRLVAGVMVASLALFLLIEGVSTPVAALLGLALLVSVGWFVVGLGARKRLGRSGAWRLEVAPEGLVLAQGGPLTEVTWESVEDVEADEELLVIRVRRVAADDLRILPVWRGDKGPIGLHDLAAVIRDTWEDANRSAER